MRDWRVAGRCEALAAKSRSHTDQRYHEGSRNRETSITGGNSPCVDATKPHRGNVVLVARPSAIG
mgnify:CR=1 FL=1